MVVRVSSLGASLSAVALALILSQPLCGADIEVDFAAANETVVGKDRIVILSVTRFTEFVASGEGKGPRAVTSLRIFYLREWLGERTAETVLTATELEVFAAGTAERPFRFAGNVHSTVHTSKNYGGYEDWLKKQSDEWSAVKLPEVKDVNLATVAGLTFRDVQVTAKRADLRIKVGSEVVVFKNVPLE